ncbi:hypothetical protein [Chitinophaga eiseniae]|uniref:Uncharacterized protein n=1 Tax=Chitinophaga eiseniae TaxID=634771 RepID=A0A847ST05_9BACT|nr:hypothetical protein [Chitinophaga eiseniae]NLR82277.1 hypothetical protein [Chitinophaga eiseniae]
METNKEPELPRGENLLLAMHTELAISIVNFRKIVSAGCKWSIATFYRKLRGRIVVNGDGVFKPVLSEAEKEMARSVFHAELRRLNDWYDKYVERSL